MTQPRRLPDDGTGRTHFCQPGGFVAALADDVEEEILHRTQADIQRAMGLLAAKDVTKDELVKAVYYLGYSSKAAVDVAKCRGERLEKYELEEEEETSGV